MQKSLAIKLLLVFGIGILLFVPISMVGSKIQERVAFLQLAKTSVEESWTGDQYLMSPVIVIPYKIKVSKEDAEQKRSLVQQIGKQIHVNLDEVDISIDARSKYLYKGIYRIPVFSGEITITGNTSVDKLKKKLVEIQSSPQFSHYEEAYIALPIKDVRGLDALPQVEINGETTSINPGSAIYNLPSGIHASLPEVAGSVSTLDFRIQVNLHGLDSLTLLPVAENITASIQSDWPHPEFIGSMLPRNREIKGAGFTAKWFTSIYSSDGGNQMESCIAHDKCQELFDLAFGVRFMQPVDVYLQSERATKYAVLIIGLSFITFFIFEQIGMTRIHPIQYTLVGLAIAVFYLLLISLTEHIAFGWAYLLSAFCCIGLICFYSGHLLNSRRSALLFCIMISSLYGTLYIIINAEDYAFLMGSILVFLVLLALMYVTRKFDWYEITEPQPDLNDSGRS